MDKLIIFGVNGFSGRHFLNYIFHNNINKKYEIYGLGSEEGINIRDINYKYIDITNQGEIENYLMELKPDYIVNFVGKYGTDDINELLSKNFDLTKNIIYTIIKNKLKLKKILLLGSAAEYGVAGNKPVKESKKLSPINYYGLAKKVQTEFAMDVYKIEKIPINIARTFNLIGAGISELLLPGKFYSLISKTDNNKSIEMKNLSSVRDYIEIEKAVEMYWKILIDGVPGEIYNVCSGRGRSSRNILKKIIKESGKTINIVENEKYHSKSDIKKIVGCNEKILRLMNA